MLTPLSLLEPPPPASYLEQMQALCADFATTAVDRDAQGGTPKTERDRLRHSGLLNLMIPKACGGLGESWTTTLALVRELAKVDGSLAHVFAYHHLGIIIPAIFGNQAQAEFYYSQSAQHNWFWCNSLNPKDLRTTIQTDGHSFRLSGAKSFCSGAKDSDMMPITAIHAETGEMVVLVMPTSRDGVTVNDDWDNMGQRQTDSGSVSFQNVVIHPDEILGTVGNLSAPFRTIRTCLAQLTFANIYLGITLGALDFARQYTLTLGESATQNPYVLHRYGEMWTSLCGAVHLTNHAGEKVQSAWEEGWNLTEQQRGDCAIAIAIAKAATTDVGLDITTQIFDVMGARSTSRQYGSDRFWRNLRTFTLHDPVDQKLHDIGDWALNQRYPTPSFYS